VKRIRRLVFPKSTSGVWMPLLAGITLTATAAVAMALWPQAQRGFSAAQRLPRAIDLYKNWLEGPVRYIIRPRERAAFERLTSNAEREMFIKQFWERRNPNPGRKTNAFKEEFYRRVAFADSHFAVGHPGWKSDRGHVYIVYGPPDEIAPRPGSHPYPSEVWKYRNIPGLGSNESFSFIDRHATGDYKLLPGSPLSR
jgi:GWxTD domain-containing protein